MLIKKKTRIRHESGQVLYIPIASIYPNPAQPRKIFNKSELDELSHSIRENGVIQPITVRPSEDNEHYQLIAGERRLRASALAGLTDVPCIVTDMDDCKSSLVALVENLQRCDLDFFEEAAGIYNLIKSYGFSQEEAAKKLGKSQSAVSNKLRLLRLPPEVMHLIAKNSLSERHARALLRLPTKEEQLDVLGQIVRKGMTVSQTEQYIEKYLVNKAGNRENEKPKFQTFIFKDLRLFINTINHAVDTMRNSGIQAQVDREEDDSSIRMTICIPKNVPRET